MDCAKTTARLDKKHLSFGIRCVLYLSFASNIDVVIIKIASQQFAWYVMFRCLSNILFIQALFFPTVFVYEPLLRIHKQYAACIT